MKASDYWSNDLLDRRQDAEFLYNFLIGEIEKRESQGRTKSYVLNVDAEWGGGKSFFLDGLALDLLEHGHIVARINAWRDDHATDPYVAIMAAIDQALKGYINKPGKLQKAWDAVKASGGEIAVRTGAAVLKGVIKQWAGVAIDDLKLEIMGQNAISNDAEGAGNDTIGTAVRTGLDAASKQIETLFDSSMEAMIQSFNRTEKAMGDFRRKLERLVQETAASNKAPLFILIDELDRCRPTYAVQLLERVKHLFDVNGVVFVFATNTAQLQHSIAGAYGANFDGFRYLKRFFDRTYVFQEPSTKEYITALVNRLPKEKIRAPDDALVEVLVSGCKCFGFDLRAIGQVMDMIDATATAWPHKIRIEIALLFPLCAHFYQTQKPDWPPRSNASLHSWKLIRSGADYQGNKVDRSINFGDAYENIIIRFSNLRNITDSFDRNYSQDATIEYVYDLFMPEWNGKITGSLSKSIQTEILGLVINAGKLQKVANEPHS